MTIDSFHQFPLSNEIQLALTELQYIKPTEVQRKVIPHALRRRDLIVKSQTGSGKTASFAIPLCEQVNWEENRPQALILTPTRELAVQVKEDISNIGRFKRIKGIAIFGKQPFHKQKLELKQKNHIVVGTPGRLLDHIQKGTLPIDKLEYLIIDEADEMLNMGFIDQVKDIIEALPKERITSIFSATITEEVEELSQKYMDHPLKIEITRAEQESSGITHYFYEVEEEFKYQLLKEVLIIENPDSCIIFCGTQQNVDQLYELLIKQSFSCDKLHGGLPQETRFSVMNNFKRGKYRYLIATDLASRGIDVEKINLVIHYDIPFKEETYVHRTGRTGRAGESGNAISFITSKEKKYLTDLESFLGFSIVKRDRPSKEMIEQSMAAFKAKKHAPPIIKKDKSDNLNKNIMRLFFNGGKRKKLRAVDFVGTISSLPGISADDIGIITIQETSTFVEILNGKGDFVLKEMKNKTIKGKQLKVHQARI
ncbi:DEAD/DEAH box helicase [Evansella tamaricis]|uniref:ATP-dependent RNA helicase DbpA n=1 Tax=Evansella tamaricis TaxID=2069301 RepID=A0ABS6JHC9_9BACI|nr:DEAD/DEAH box helicase [Evansella tamaricis]MBU9713080.1 DEAD/DEAH box helicase [Evansella tamaricis]